MLHRSATIAFSLLIACLLAAPASAHVIARVSPTSSFPELDSSFAVEIWADFSAPGGTAGLLGFGLDLAYDGSKLSLVGPPTIASPFTAFGGPDGDGLGGIAPAALPSGSILLATLWFDADALGTSELLLGLTPADLTEGFPLDPTGFDGVTFVAGQVTVVPEPASAWLVGTGLALCALARRQRQRA